MTNTSLMANRKRVPTKEDLEEFLGPPRYRRFDLIYNEIIDLGLDPHMSWNELDKIWYLGFRRGKTPLFTLRWGIDFFYAHAVIHLNNYTRVARDKDITPDALAILQMNPPNQTKHTVTFEANLEKMREQEGFFELLPVMIRVLT